MPRHAANWQNDTQPDVHVNRQAPRSAVPSPEQHPYVPGATSARPGRARGAGTLGRHFLALLARIASIVCRLLALAFTALVIANAFSIGPARLYLLGLTSQVSSWVPSLLSGVLVVATPFGGALRGDFIIAAIILFVLDWLMARRSAALSRRF